MNHYRISEIPKESWIALYGVFWRERLEILGEYEAVDGITPLEVETTKHGIRIAGEMWFLPNMDTYPLNLLLARPRFSSILEFNPEKLKAATIRSSSFEGGVLRIELG